MNRRPASFWLVVVHLSVLFPAGCRPPVLSEGQRERNRIFAEVVRRADLRSLGDDRLLRDCLRDQTRTGPARWAAQALGGIAGPPSLPWLFEALASPIAETRAWAAFAIGEMEDRERLQSESRKPSVRALRELRSALLDTSWEVQLRAVEALGKAGSRDEAHALVQLHEEYSYDGSPPQRRYLSHLITALMRLNDPIARPLLHRFAAEHDAEIQWRAANALYRMRDDTAAPVLLPLLRSSNPNVRAHAARALGVCRSPGLAEYLVPLLSIRQGAGDRQEPLFVRVSALQGLGSLRAASALPAIEACLREMPPAADDPDSLNFAIQAATALGTIGSSRAEGMLCDLLSAPPPVPNYALVALAKVLRGMPDRFFEVVSPSRFASSAGRRAWAEAQAELGGERSVRELLRVLAAAADSAPASGSDTAVPIAIKSLARLNALNPPQMLEGWLNSDDEVVLEAAVSVYPAEAVGTTPWRRLLQVYESAGGSRYWSVRLAVVNRLELWGQEPEVQSALRRAVGDPERNVRMAAMRLLRKTGASDTPEDPGPSMSRMTGGGYGLLAAMRQDRTLAVITTARGAIEVELFREDAPLTVDNFVSLAGQGFYNGLDFMRAVPYFVIQGGDPRGDQEGGPGYTIRCEINQHAFLRGSIGMAHSGRDTAGSQFFITLSPQPHLDGSYTCFGRVISGMEVADRIVPGDRIHSITIETERSLLDYRKY